MLTLPYTLDHAVQELAMVRARHAEEALRRHAAAIRNLHTRPCGHDPAAIAITTPDL
jgi:hypothetical protein